MKQKILYSLLFSLFFYASFAQEKTAEHLYPFNGKLFNLQTLQYENAVEIPAVNFKSSSKYAVRYQGLGDKLAYKGVLFESIDATGLLLKNLETRAATPIPNAEKDLPLLGQCFLLECLGGVLHVKPLKDNNGYMIYKYNELGKKEFEVQLEHSKFVQHGELTYYLPYLGYSKHTASSLVFSSYIDRIAKTVIISTLDGSVSNFDFSSIGVIRDPSLDMDIYGFILLRKENNSLVINYMGNNVLIERSYFSEVTHAETLVIDQTLVLATYNGRSPNAQLLAIDINTKEVLWEADLAKFGGVESSTYFNALWLGAYQNNLILEGYESKGKYLQVLDLKTGKRLWKSF